jgi:predicted pyridoxine 5'-phosphate oxidase superfamily flavin-nucleotide-binding protein
MVALEDAARAVLDESRYVVLGTADAGGRPWVSPVFYTMSGYRELVWMSSPEALHSRNLAVRPEVSLVVFDSRVEVGGAFAVYLSGVAAEVTGEAVAAVAAAYGAAALPKGGRLVRIDEVTGDGSYRMYRATIREHWVLDPDSRPDGRKIVTL